MKDDLLKKIKNKISNAESIKDIDSAIDKAIEETEDIIKNKDISQAMRIDIAYFRFLLFVKQSAITEMEFRMYDKAIAFVAKAPVKQELNKDKKHYFARVGIRRIF